MAADILIIDDEADIRELIAGILQDEGFETRLAHNSDAALSEVSLRGPSLVVLDIWLQGSKLDGLDLLLELKQRVPDLPVVIISGHGNIETAVAAIKRGAYDYIEKPFNADRLLAGGEPCPRNHALEARERATEGPLRFRCRTYRSIRSHRGAASRRSRRLRPPTAACMIMGPMGAGKELVARTLHAMSTRANGPFVVLSAATMAPERLGRKPVRHRAGR